MLHDPNIKKAFCHTFDYLVLCAENGVTLNKGKFKFAQREVEFVGYKVGWLDFHPLIICSNRSKNLKCPPNQKLQTYGRGLG